MKYYILPLLFLFSFSIAAQQTITEEETLENQFDKIYRISTTYQKYKVIDKARFQKLKSDVLDSLNNYKKLLLKKEEIINVQQKNINNLNNKITQTQLDLDSSIKKVDSISLFGLELKKVTYNIILWLIISVLLISLFFFIYKFTNSNVETKEAKNDLIDIEQEFEQHRKKTLLKEQKLRRQLQDEINKQRKV